MLPKILNSRVKLPQKTSKRPSQGPDFSPIYAFRGGFLCKQHYYAMRIWIRSAASTESGAPALSEPCASSP